MLFAEIDGARRGIGDRRVHQDLAELRIGEVEGDKGMGAGQS
jgi:hypothetical protein